MSKIKKWISKNKDNIALCCIAAILILLCVILVYGISGLVMWAVGSFIIHVFDINYEWTFLHGLATSFILSILRSIFKSNITTKQERKNGIF